MVGSASLSGSGWIASVKFTIYDINSGAAVAGASVMSLNDQGNFYTCVTGSDGSCTVSSGILSLQYTPSRTYVLLNVSGDHLIYMGNGSVSNYVIVNRP